MCPRGTAGEFCEVLVPIVFNGDPHLSTGDGRQYDYFGVGLFWGCASEAADFGVQVRAAGRLIDCLIDELFD